jgi:hypothetical protein
MAWKVGALKITAAVSGGPLHGFSIEDEHGSPMLTLAYATLEEAAGRRRAMAVILESTKMIADANGKGHSPADPKD